MRKKILVLFLAAVLAGPAYAGTKSYTVGDSNFGGFLDLNYDFKIASTSEKSYVDFSPEIGAKLFKRKFGILGADLVVGNYGSYKFDLKNISDTEVNVEKVKKWQAYIGVLLFGRTIYSTSKNVPATGAPVADVNRWYKKQMPTISYPVGPVKLEVRYGATLSTSVKPKVSPYWLGIKAEMIPSISSQAFAEGGVNAWVLRGGIGANLTLFSGRGGLKAQLDLKQKFFDLSSLLGLSTLSGKIYAFVDRLKIKCCFRKSWKRWINVTITSWKGLSWQWEKRLWRKTW